MSEHFVPGQDMYNDIQKVKDSAYKTKDRMAREGFDTSDDQATMDLLVEFCDLLLNGGSVDTFLSGQDMEP